MLKNQSWLDRNYPKTEKEVSIDHENFQGQLRNLDEVPSQELEAAKKFYGIKDEKEKEVKK